MQDSGTWPLRRWRPSVTVEERASGLALSPFFGYPTRWSPSRPQVVSGWRGGRRQRGGPVRGGSADGPRRDVDDARGSVGGFRCILRETQDSFAVSYRPHCGQWV